MDNKPWYLSKTLWINFITIGAGFIPAVGAYVSAHPGIGLDAIAAVNIVLRYITRSAIQIG